MKKEYPDILKLEGEKWHNPDPATGKLGTRVPAEWLQTTEDSLKSLTLEMLEVLKAAGINPNELNNTQIRDAIQKILLNNSTSTLSDRTDQVATIKVVNDVNRDVVTAQKTANTANDKANAAQTTANQAKNAAATADIKADNAHNRISTIEMNVYNKSVTYTKGEVDSLINKNKSVGIDQKWSISKKVPNVEYINSSTRPIQLSASLDYTHNATHGYGFIIDGLSFVGGVSGLNPIIPPGSKWKFFYSGTTRNIEIWELET